MKTKTEENPRSLLATFRVTRDEKLRYEKAARQYNISVSELYRRSVDYFLRRPGGEQ